MRGALVLCARALTAPLTPPPSTGTHWSPGDPPPAQFKLAQRDIEDRYTTAVGQGAAEVLELARRAREEAEAADAKAAMTKAGSAAARDAPAKENGRRPKKTD